MLCVAIHHHLSHHIYPLIALNNVGNAYPLLTLTLNRRRLQVRILLSADRIQDSVRHHGRRWRRRRTYGAAADTQRWTAHSVSAAYAALKHRCPVGGAYGTCRSSFTTTTTNSQADRSFIISVSSKGW